MKPDFDRAATAAMQLLIEHQITETPIVPLPILKNYPGVRVLSFTHMADEAGVQRDDLVPLFGPRQEGERKDPRSMSESERQEFFQQMQERMAKMQDAWAEIEDNQKAFDLAMKDILNKDQYKQYKKDRRKEEAERQRRMQGGMGGPRGGMGGPGGGGFGGRN